MNSKQTHLKNISNGRVFLFSETLANRNDMVPCNAQGEIASGHIGDAESIDATQTRRKTKFLGNVKNGVLYPYTDYLAERNDMVSIDTEEQWDAMRKTGDAPEQAADTVAPALTREPKEPVVPKEPVIPASAQGPGSIVLPVIEGMGAREAKTVLLNWAKEKFGDNVALDRRIPLPDFIKECEELSIKAMDKAAAGQ